MPRDELPRDLDAYPLVELEPVFSLRGLIAWLETQPPETKYDYSEARTCLLTRFVEHSGGECTREGYFIDGRVIGLSIVHREPRDPAEVMFTAARCGNWTYGAALTRARVALSGLE